MKIFRDKLYTEIHTMGRDDYELVLRCDAVPDDALAIVWGTRAECEACKQILDYHIAVFNALFENSDMIAQGG